MGQKQQPSKKTHAQIAALHSGRIVTTDLPGDLAHHGLRLVLQQILETEEDEHLGRSWHQHAKEEANEPSHRDYHNSYERCFLKTRMGKIAIEKPRLSGTATPFRSSIWKPLSALDYRLA